VLLEGPRVVLEAVAAGVRLEVLALAEGSGFRAPAEHTVILGERALDSLSQTVTPQGVLAIARRETVEAAAALSAARDVLGYEPAVGLEDGLRRTVEWLRDRLRLDAE